MSKLKDDVDQQGRLLVQKMTDDELRDFLLACPHCVNMGIIAGCDKREDGLVQCSGCKTLWDNWNAWCRSCNWHGTSKKSLKVLAKIRNAKNDKKKQKR